MIRELTRVDELTVPPQRDVEYWSENYCFDAYDPQSNAGLWMHLGRWSKSSDLWREQTKLYLPDGSVLLWKTLGGRGETSGPTSATLSFECVSPGRVWELTFDGPARHVRSEQLLDGALTDGPLIHVKARFRFESAQPVWDLDEDSERQIWCSSHYEQPGRVTGHVEYGDERVELHDPPYADTVGELTGPYSFGLRLKSGQLVTIEATPGLTVTSSFVVPYEKLHGVSADASHISCHQCTTFLVDGVPAAGLTERSFVA